MSLTFNNFAQQIPPEILERGYRYFRDRRVLELAFDEADEIWNAVVKGTERYGVEITREPDGTLSCECDCPYDMGEHCKHVVAVLHAILEVYPDVVGGSLAKPKSARKSRIETLRQKLVAATPAQIVEIVVELARGDRELLDNLLLRLEGESVDYRRVVRGILKPGRGAYDSLDYAGSERAAKKINGLLAEARRGLSAGEFEKAVAICEGVIDETVPALSYADDSNGSLGGCISEAVDYLEGVSDELDAADRQQLFAYSLERARSAEFRGWDWGWALLQMALELTDSPERRAQLLAALDSIEAEVRSARGFSDNYAIQQVTQVRLTLIEDFEDEAAARAFLYEHRQLDNVRMLLINRLHDEGSYAKAVELIKEGIAASEARGYPGLKDQYLALQLKVLQATGDRPGMLKIHRELWLSKGDDEGYRALKKLVPDREWPDFVQGLLKQLEHNASRAVWILAREGRWHEVLQAYEQHPTHTWILDTNREPLESRFPEQMAKHYARIVAALVANTNRSNYREAVENLRRIGKLSGRARMQEIIEQLRLQYPKRPALHQELRRLK